MKLRMRTVSATPTLAGLRVQLSAGAARGSDGTRDVEPFYPWDRLVPGPNQGIDAGRTWQLLDGVGRAAQRPWSALTLNVRGCRAAQLALRCHRRAMRQLSRRANLCVVDQWMAPSTWGLIGWMLYVVAGFGGQAGWFLFMARRLWDDPVAAVDPVLSRLSIIVALSLPVTLLAVMVALLIYGRRYFRPPLVERSHVHAEGVDVRLQDGSIATVGWQRWHDVAIGRSRRLMSNDGRPIRWFLHVPRRTRQLLGITLKDRFPAWVHDVCTINGRLAIRFVVVLGLLGLLGQWSIESLAPADETIPVASGWSFAILCLCIGLGMGACAWSGFVSHGLIAVHPHRLLLWRRRWRTALRRWRQARVRRRATRREPRRVQPG